MLIRRAQHAHLLTRALPRVERLRLATLVVPNQRVSRGHHMFRRTEVLAERHRDGAIKALLKFKDVSNVRAAPAIDRLIRIAHHADVPMPTGDVARNSKLRAIGVLVFVDQHIAVAARGDRAQRVIRSQTDGGAHE